MSSACDGKELASLADEHLSRFHLAVSFRRRLTQLQVSSQPMTSEQLETVKSNCCAFKWLIYDNNRSVIYWYWSQSTPQSTPVPSSNLIWLLFLSFVSFSSRPTYGFRYVGTGMHDIVCLNISCIKLILARFCKSTTESAVLQTRLKTKLLCCNTGDARLRTIY